MGNSYIKRSMQEDIRSMRRIASNIKHKKGVNGYVGVMYDANKGKTERQLRALNSETVVYKMDKILTIEEFNKLDKDMQKTYMIAWRAKFTAQEIKDGLGIYNKAYYDLLDKLEIPLAQRGRPKGTKGKIEKVLEYSKDVTTPLIKKEDSETVVIPESEKGKPSALGFNIELYGNLSSEELSERLHGLALMIESTKGEYEVKLQFIQK